MGGGTRRQHRRRHWRAAPELGTRGTLILLQLLAQLTQECLEQRERLPQEIRRCLLGETSEGLGDGPLVARASNGHAPGSGGHLSGADSESQEENTQL